VDSNAASLLNLPLEKGKELTKDEYERLLAAAQAQEARRGNRWTEAISGGPYFKIAVYISPSMSYNLLRIKVINHRIS
jgi:hypothetical protein